MGNNWDKNQSTVTSSGESVVEEINRLFMASDFVSGVQISAPLRVVITTKGFNRQKRRKLYSLQSALTEKHPNLNIIFEVRD